MMIPVFALSLENARGMLTVSVILVGVALALFIGAAAFFMAGKSWFRAAKGELTSPPEDDIPSPELLEMLGVKDEEEEEE